MALKKHKIFLLNFETSKKKIFLLTLKIKQSRKNTKIMVPVLLAVANTTSPITI